MCAARNGFVVRSFSFHFYNIFFSFAAVASAHVACDRRYEVVVRFKTMSTRSNAQAGKCLTLHLTMEFEKISLSFDKKVEMNGERIQHKTKTKEEEEKRKKQTQDETKWLCGH